MKETAWVILGTLGLTIGVLLIVYGFTTIFQPQTVGLCVAYGGQEYTMNYVTEISTPIERQGVLSCRSGVYVPVV